MTDELKVNALGAAIGTNSTNISHLHIRAIVSMVYNFVYLFCHNFCVA